MRLTFLTLCALLLVALLVIGAALSFGGPKPLPPLPSVSDPFRGVDRSGLPGQKGPDRLHRPIGVSAFNALPVTEFALRPEAQQLLTTHAAWYWR